VEKKFVATLDYLFIFFVDQVVPGREPPGQIVESQTALMYGVMMVKDNYPF
jgi:hypothetical protein